MSKKGYFGSSTGLGQAFGGRFVPEVLVPALDELATVYSSAKKDRKFQAEFNRLATTYSCRPTPLFFCDNLTETFRQTQRGKLGAKIYLKREDLNHTGAHKFNNVLGQALLAKKMGKKRLIAETGAGQHGVATATIAAKFGLKCTVYMGAVDIARQRPNVFWMERLGAEVVSVKSGTARLKDAVAEALRDWATSVEDTHYLLGSALGPHPFPEIVRDFQSVIGRETKIQFKKISSGKLPDYLIACVGGGSNAIGLFHPFLRDKKVKMIGVEAGGIGDGLGQHAARLSTRKVAPTGVFEGFFGHFLQDRAGNLAQTHSISAGLDHPGVGPEHSHFWQSGRAEYVNVRDREVLAAAGLLMRTEGIIPALESSHALAYSFQLAKRLPKSKSIVVNLSGRGDKDIFIYAEALKDEGWQEFLKSQVK